MTPGFDILDRTTDVHCHRILEASAGTGKTFSIENIVARVLLEDETANIENLLLITFTRASARDLRKRVRNNLEMVLRSLKSTAEHDYLKPFVGDEKAIKKIKESLFIFDQANIYTIHGFCYQALSDNLLEASFSMGSVVGDKDSYDEILSNVTRDFLRTSLHHYSFQQIKRVLKRCKGRFSELEKLIQKYLSTSNTIVTLESFHDLYIEFKEASRQFRHAKSDFDKHYPNYKKFSKDAPEVVERMFSIISGDVTVEEFDQIIADGLVYVEALDPARLKKNKEPASSLLLEQMRHSLKPIIDKASSPDFILASMIKETKKLLQERLEYDEKLLFDDLLRLIDEASENPLFVKALRKKFSKVIVDEFQDTDPLQWDILKRLFLSEEWKGHMVIVGDPKQSIYAFRQADIYTYLNACKTLGEGSKATLNVNYRSQPTLLNDLNRLFSVPNMFPLPKIKSDLPYPQVSSPKTETEKEGLSIWHYQSEKWALEEAESHFFPHIVQEILRLNKPWSSYAILVRDRFQGERLTHFLSKWGIPSQKIECSDDRKVAMLSALQEMIEATLSPKNLNKVKIALGGIIFGWSDQKILSLSDEAALESILCDFYLLRHRLIQWGFLSFFRALLKMNAEKILARKRGEELYQQLLFYGDQIVKHQLEKNETPEGLLFYIDQLKNLSGTSTPIEDHDVVQVMTLHASKGLEFDVVFPIGLINRTPEPGLIVPSDQGLKPLLSKEDSEYKHHCAEVDAEKMRQFYVALTRAKELVYLPYYEVDKPPKPGTASPIELFVEKYGELPYQDLKPIKLEPYVEHFEPKLIAPPEVKIPGEERYVYSFSALSNVKHRDVQAPHNFLIEEKTPHTLPAGSETGIFLHSIFEKIDLQYVDTKEQIAAQLELSNTNFAPWHEVIVEMVYGAFHTPLNGVTLSQATQEESFREVEFLYSTDDGFRKGIIDFVCCIEGRYYLVDWKTNWLGPEGEFSLEELMDDHDYNLQAKLYREALSRYLSLYDQEIAGVYYIFLRGGCVRK